MDAKDKVIERQMREIMRLRAALAKIAHDGDENGDIADAALADQIEQTD